MDGKERQKLQLVLAFAAIYIVWGSTYLAIRFAIETIPPFLMAGMRFLAAGIVLYTWARWRGAKAASPVEWRSAAIIGVALLLCSNGGVTWAEQRVPSGVAALFVATVPMWIVLLDWLLHGGSRPGRGIAAGLILGFAGVMLLVGPNPFLSLQPLNLAGVGALLFASFSWANGSLYSRKAKLPSSQLLAASMEMLSGGLALVIAGLVSGEWGRFDPAAVTLRSWFSLAYLSVFGSIIGFTAYIWLIQVTAPSRVATYAYVNPIIALLLGWGFAGERLSPQIFVAAGVIVFAVVTIITSRAKSASVPVPKESPQPRIEIVPIEKNLVGATQD